jgi:protoporphyrin/coproporphyrin ferrochelatase
MGRERYRGRPEHEHGTGGGTGVLLVNLGTPEAPTTAAVRRYLAEFLWDPRIVEAPRWLWWLVLHGVILRVRPARSAALYREIWTDEGSPLLVHGRRQAAALQLRLAEDWPGEIRVVLAMRYGRPSVEEGLETLRTLGIGRLVVLPLFPQYSGTTTGSVYDAVTRVLGGWRWLPELRFLTHYHDHPGYIAALAASVREHQTGRGRPQRLLFSFHGIPRRYLDAGDPYHCECHKTARLVAEALDLPRDAWALTFQSRVGREEWLKPYTDEVLEAWGREGLGKVQVLCPGFSADCLETLEEIAGQGSAQFREAGGGTLEYIPALNERPDHIAALADLVTAATEDWRRSAARAEDPGTVASRARALGAQR